MILIADTHAGNEGDVDEFFQMLHALEKTDEPIVFLGDIFDLWIGIKRYEDDEHRRFINWCTEQKSKRSVHPGLV